MAKKLKKIDYVVRDKPTWSPDLVGNTYNSFYVLKYLGSSKKGSVWLCRCECGNELELTTGYLMEPRGNTF